LNLGTAWPTMPPGDLLDVWLEWTTSQAQLQAWVKDLRSRFLAVSLPLARACGVRADAMIGRSEAGFFWPALIRQFRHDDLRVVALNEVALVEEFGPGGRFATIKRPLRDARGRIAATVGIAYQWPRDRPLPAVPLNPRGSRPSVPAWLQRIRDRIEREFRAPLRVHRVAAEAGRHPNYVSRAFRRCFGVSAVERLHRLRVAWVGEALLSGGLPLSAVAQHAGFADQAHMTRVFKRYYGLTPGEYGRALALK